MATAPLTSVAVLAVLPDISDQKILHNLFNHSKWELRVVRTLQEAQVSLLDLRIGVVICESRFTDGHDWKDLLDHTARMRNPPPLIVTDRLADDSLWAEVLNLGGYDLLMKPFDSKEVYRVVSLAWLFWKDQFDRKADVGKQSGSEETTRT